MYVLKNRENFSGMQPAMCYDLGFVWMKIICDGWDAMIIYMTFANHSPFKSGKKCLKLLNTTSVLNRLDWDQLAR